MSFFYKFQFTMSREQDLACLNSLKQHWRTNLLGILHAAWEREDKSRFSNVQICEINFEMMMAYQMIDDLTIDCEQEFADTLLKINHVFRLIYHTV
jgi:hypothetical protein